MNVNAGFLIDVMANVTATTTTTKVLEGTIKRNYLMIVNNGTVAVYAKVGSAQSGNEGILIPAGGNWEPSLAPSDAIYIKSASSTSSVTLLTGKDSL